MKYASFAVPAFYKKPLLWAFLAVLLVTFLFPASVRQVHAASSVTLPKVSLLPSSSFYFLKEWRRGIERLFTTKPEDKVKLELSIRDERAAELAKLKDQSNIKSETIEDAVTSYVESDKLVDESIQNLEAVDRGKAVVYSENAELHKDAHIEILSGVEDKIDDVATKEALSKIINENQAIEVSTPPTGDAELDRINRELKTVILNIEDAEAIASTTQATSTTASPTKSIQALIVPTLPPKAGGSYCERLIASAASYKQALSTGVMTQVEYETKVKTLGKDYERCLAFPQKSETVPPTTGETILCTQEYNPICGIDNKTYSNECLARTVGVTIKSRGECGSDSAMSTSTKPATLNN